MSVARGMRRGDFGVAAGLLGVALLLGGGSAAAPLPRMIVEIAGVAALGWFFARGWSAPTGRATVIALVILAALVALAILQTVPLPPAVWRGLPGRAVVAGVLDAVGAHDAWSPLSLDPAATRESGYFLIPPIAMFVAALHLGRDARLKLMLLVLVAAVVSALLVMIQAQGAMGLSLYEPSRDTKGLGIFANKNHNAALLDLAIPLTAMLGRSSIWQPGIATRRAVTGTLIAILSVAVLGCLSRAGVALLPIALAACVPLLGGWPLVRRHWKIGIAALAGLLLAAVVVAQSSIVKETFDRFGASQEGRYIFWPDVVFAIRQYMPWGSGLGTFVPVFRIDESLQSVHPTYTNHAHSDYLEIALEAGIPGLLLLGAFLIWFAATAWRGVRSRIDTPDFAPMLASVVGMALILAASIVDYPLRTLSLACVFALFAATIASPAPFPNGPGDDPTR